MNRINIYAECILLREKLNFPSSKRLLPAVLFRHGLILDLDSWNILAIMTSIADMWHLKVCVDTNRSPLVAAVH